MLFDKYFDAFELERKGGFLHVFRLDRFDWLTSFDADPVSDINS